MPFPTDLQERTRLAATGMRAFVRLSALWGLTLAEQAKLLGAASPEQYSAWLQGDVGDAGEDLLLRLSHVLSIQNALARLGAASDGGQRWLRGQNQVTTFEGGSPLDRMLRGGIGDLAAVRDYLDARFEWG